MSKNSKKRQEPVVVVYARLNAEDHAELKRREAALGAPIARQIRILIHQALWAKGVIK